MTWNWRIQSSHPFSYLKLWIKRILHSTVFLLQTIERPVAWGSLAHPSYKSSIYHPLIHSLTEVGSRPPLLHTYQAQSPESMFYLLESLPILSPPFIKSWHKTDGRWALLLQAIQGWLLTLTFLALLLGMKLKIFPGIERHRPSDPEGALGIRAFEYCYCAPGNSIVTTPLWQTCHVNCAFQR